MFIDKAHQQQFDTDGFVKIPLLNPQEVDVLKGLFESLNVMVTEGTNALNYEVGDAKNEQIKSKIQEVFLARTPSVITSDYYIDGGTFITKSAGDNSECKIHQDWNMVNETEYTSIIAWCPLIDVNATNGALQAVKGSQRLFSTIRSVNISPLYLPIDETLEPYLTCIEAKAGEVIFFSHRLFHGSKPNHQNQTRVAAVFGFLPKAAPRLHYLRTNIRGTDEICVFEPEANFYYNNPFAFTVGQAMQRPHYFIPFSDSYTVDREQFFATLKKERPSAGLLKRLTGWLN